MKDKSTKQKIADILSQPRKRPGKYSVREITEMYEKEDPRAKEALAGMHIGLMEAKDRSTNNNYIEPTIIKIEPEDK